MLKSYTVTYLHKEWCVEVIYCYLLAQGMVCWSHRLLLTCTRNDVLKSYTVTYLHKEWCVEVIDCYLLAAGMDEG